MNFKLINDCGVLNVPLLELTVFPFKANVMEWFTTEGAGGAKVSLGANFYNNKLSVWEPLIEKWGIAVEVPFLLEKKFLKKKDTKRCNLKYSFLSLSWKLCPMWQEMQPKSKLMLQRCLTSMSATPFWTSESALLPPCRRILRYFYFLRKSRFEPELCLTGTFVLQEHQKLGDRTEYQPYKIR